MDAEDVVLLSVRTEYRDDRFNAVCEGNTYLEVGVTACTTQAAVDDSRDFVNDKRLMLFFKCS